MNEYTILDWLEQVAAPAPRQPITDPARLLPKQGVMRPYQRMVARITGKYGDYRDRPYGGSWHRVQGQPESDLLARRQKEYRRWLKEVAKRCRENPSSTFVYKPKGPPPPSYEVQRHRGKVRSVDDAMVQLQLLGVSV